MYDCDCPTTYLSHSNRMVILPLILVKTTTLYDCDSLTVILMWCMIVNIPTLCLLFDCYNLTFPLVITTALWCIIVMYNVFTFWPPSAYPVCLFAKHNNPMNEKYNNNNYLHNIFLISCLLYTIVKNMFLYLDTRG